MDKEICKECQCSDDKERKNFCANYCNLEIKKKLKVRLNRIEGQIKGIHNMIEKDAYCDDILNQISSVRAALGGVSKLILEGHLKHCVVDEIKAGKEEKIIEELIHTLDKMLKL